MMDDEKFDNLFPSAYQQSDVPEKKECRFWYDNFDNIFDIRIVYIYVCIKDHSYSGHSC